MTRINTNVSSLVAQNILGRSNDDLQTALTRLSTGVRINSGKDDPAGLIASENLRADIVSVEKAITNSERANQVIATADSALGQVSSLLNDIRALVTESANTGALSDEQIAANQLQVDSALEALNRIAQTTEFQGRKLLNGSLDFTTAAGANFGEITDLNIDQANLGATGSLAVETVVTTAATQAQIQITGIDATTSAAKGVNDAAFTATLEQATNGTITYGTGTLTLDAVSGQAADGAEGNELATITLAFSGAAGATYTAATNTLAVTVTTADGSTDVTDIVTAINAGSDFSATVGTNPLVDQAAATGATVTTSLSGGQDASTDTITLTTVNNTNDFNATTVAIEADATLAANTASASYDADTDVVTVKFNGTRTYDQLATAIQTDLSTLFTAAATTGTDTLNSIALTNDPTSISVSTSNTTPGNPGGLSEDVVFELSGTMGAEVFSIQAGTSIENIASQINLFSDSTGVNAEVDSVTPTTLNITSSAYGSGAFVDINVVSEDDGDFTAAIGSGSRDVGTDVVATVNGLLANGDGNKLSINTASLDLSLELNSGFTGTINFSITGGGALFQLGPDVVSNQQARMGISSVNTASLGGASGLMYQLGSGGTADLFTDTTTAYQIVEDAITEVTTLRGRLGAFQRTTLETNISALNDVLVNLTDAESSIRDADFAAETANLTRAQILVQSGTAVLAIANSNPQNVLALLR